MKRSRLDPLADPAPLVRRVYAYAASVFGEGADAEDVTSETIERALRYRGTYDPAKSAPATWLLGIARRCVADRVGEIRHEPDDEIELLPAPGNLELEAADRLVVAAAVRTLPARDRELVALRYGADLTAAQIGELLGLRTNAVEVALHRVHVRLRRELSDAGPGASVDAPRKGFDVAEGI